MGQLEKRFNQRLLLESVDAVPIFVTPPPASVHFALSERYLTISQDLEAIRDFVRNRGGRQRPLAGRSEVKDILASDSVAGLSYIDLGQQLSHFVGAGLPRVAQALESYSPVPVPVDDLTTVFRDLAVDVGGVWALLYLEEQGITYEIRSGCGLLPFSVSAGAVAGAVAIPAAFKASELKREKQIVGAVRNVAAGQEIFRARNGRYAQNLWEMRRAMVIEADVGRGYKGGYLLKLKSSGTDNWAFDVRPVAGGGRHFYCDHTGIIRAEAEGPAGSESPVATGIGQ